MLRVIIVRRGSLNMRENDPKVIIAVSVCFPFVVSFGFWVSFGLLALGCYIFGTGVCSRASCIICCGVISSVSASVVSDILCGITRGASFFMSSGIMKFLWFSRA